MPKNKIESIEACVFNALGTLLDFHSVAAQSRDDLVDKANQGANSWWKNQLQYSWFRSLMQKFVPWIFWGKQSMGPLPLRHFSPIPEN